MFGALGQPGPPTPHFYRQEPLTFIDRALASPAPQPLTSVGQPLTSIGQTLLRPPNAEAPQFITLVGRCRSLQGGAMAK